MPLRRAGTLVIALALVACTEVKQSAQPTDFVFASYASPNIPTPNDLAIAAIPGNAPCNYPALGGQGQLLCQFKSAGGWPSDQEVPVSIPFNAVHWETAATAAKPYGHYAPVAAPAIDTATVTPETVVIRRLDSLDGVATDVAFDPLTVASAAGSCTGTPTVCTPATLSFRLPKVNGSRRWAAGGRFVVAVRGGPNGIKTTDGKQVYADSAVALVLPNKDLTNKENQPLGALPAAQVPQLEMIRAAGWQPVTFKSTTSSTAPFGEWRPTLPTAPTKLTAALSAITAPGGTLTKIPLSEIATFATFGAAPYGAVTVDAGSGTVPLPFDLLRNPTTGKIAFNAAFGAAAAGLTTLDGFSTTAMVMAPTSLPVDASTVNGSTVLLYDMTGGTPTLVRELKHELGLAAAGAPGANPAAAGYVAQPTPIIYPSGATLAPGVTCPAAGGCSPLIGLQPAVPAPVPLVATFYLPPLKESTSYAVVVTDGVKDMFGRKLVRSTFARLMLDFTVPLSTVPGVDAGTAAGLTALGAALTPVWSALPTGITKANVVAAYTFKTQTVTPASTAILAFAGTAAPTAVDVFTKAQVATDYGISETAFTRPTAPTDPVSAFAEVHFTTNNLLLSGLTGGMLDTAHPTPEPIVALVALPDPALVTDGCPTGFPGTFNCAPLVVFQTGLPGYRGWMLPIAAELAAKGFVVAAIDGDKFGDRTYCSGATQAAANAMCAPTATCDDVAALHTPGDPTIVGRCSGGNLLKVRADCQSPNAPTPSCFSTAAPKGQAVASGNLVVSLNLFRTRDTFRQDIIDQATLVNALAPAAPRTAGTDPFADHLALSNLAVNPDEVYIASLSLGTVKTSLSLAVNPRFKKAALQSAFATIVDDFSQSPEDSIALDAMLATIGVLPGTADYLQFLQVAKWIIDPADPANYAAALRSGGKPILHQIAFCDHRVTNSSSDYFTGSVGLPVPVPGASGTGFAQYFVNSASGAVCATDFVDHGFLIDPTATPTLTAKAQASFADFLETGAAQPVTVRP
jgi:hypothetical protein